MTEKPVSLAITGNNTKPSHGPIQGYADAMRRDRYKKRIGPKLTKTIGAENGEANE